MLCTKKKTKKCPHCVRKFKTNQGLEYHIEHHHQGKKHPCPKCGVLLPDKSMHNHMRRHSSQAILEQARTYQAKVSARQRYFSFTSRRLRKRKPVPKAADTTVSKSAPAKLKKSRSPRKKPGK